MNPLFSTQDRLTRAVLLVSTKFAGLLGALFGVPIVAVISIVSLSAYEHLTRSRTANPPSASDEAA